MIIQQNTPQVARTRTMFASWRARLTPSASTSASCHRLRAAALGAHSVYRRADLAPAWYSVNGNTSSRAAPPPVRLCRSPSPRPPGLASSALRSRRVSGGSVKEPRRR